MKILIDLTYISPSSVSGVVNYSYRLIKGFEQLKTDHEIILLTTNENNIIIENKCPGFHKVILPFDHVFFLKHIYFLKGYIYKHSINRIIKRENISLLFTPYLYLGTLFTSKVPQVGVLHDTFGYIQLKDKGVKGYLYMLLEKMLLKRMSHIITISNSAKESILSVMPFLKVPVSVIYNSVLVEKPLTEKKFSSISPYLLYVNTLEPYKNLETLVKAFGLLKDKIKHNIVVKAKKLPYWDDSIVPLLTEYEINDRVILIQENFTAEKLSSLYSEADLFVTTSMREGFGFTPIEAAINKVPVICSKESALYETTMGLLNYYEPVKDFKILAEKILSVINSTQNYENLLLISECYKKIYSPLAQAESFMKLFPKVARKDVTEVRVLVP